MASEKQPAIYGLVDPRTNALRYIGQSIDPDARFRQHVSLARTQGNWPLYDWIAELHEAGHRPEIITLGECGAHELDHRERELIRQHREQGAELLNRASGGRSRSAARAELLTKRDWVAIGYEFKCTREGVLRFSDSIAEFCPKNSAPMRAIGSALGKLDKASTDFEDIVARYFPQWPSLTRVFNGSVEDHESGFGPRGDYRRGLD